MAKIDDDEVSNNSGNRSFQDIVEARLSRRSFLGGGLAAAAAVSFSGVNALLRSVPASAQDIGQGSLRPLLGFQGVPVSDADTVVVPPGYSATSSRRVGRPGLQWPGVQARWQQQRRRPGAAVGHAQ